jgi:hypothetical protein
MFHLVNTALEPMVLRSTQVDTMSLVTLIVSAVHQLLAASFSLHVAAADTSLTWFHDFLTTCLEDASSTVCLPHSLECQRRGRGTCLGLHAFQADELPRDAVRRPHGPRICAVLAAVRAA